MPFNLKDYIYPASFFRKYFNEDHERTLIIRKNVAYSVFLRGISLLCNLLLVPITINYLDPARYGIWLTLSSIVGWMYYFDIGIGNGLRNKLTESLARKDFKASVKYVSTSYLLIGLIAVGILIAFVTVIPLLNWARILNTNDEYAHELMILALIVFGFFSVQFVFRQINTILLADLRTAENDLVGVLINVISFVIIYILTIYTRGSLIYLGIAMSAVPVVVFAAATIILFRGRYRPIRPKLSSVDWSYSRTIINLGLKFFILQVGAIVVFQTANIIIIQLFGPDAVTEFNIAYKYFSMPSLLYIIVIVPLWSAYTDAYTSGDFEWMKKTFMRYQLLAIVFSLGILLMIIISPLVYRIWVGEEINIRLGVSVFVAIYIISYIWMTLYVYIINGIGMIKIQVITSVAEIVLNIPMAIILGKYIGINGVILSMIIFCIARCIWAPIQINKIINRKAHGIWNS